MTRHVLTLLTFGLAAATFAQHDPGRNAVRLMVKGKLEQAAAALAKTPHKKNSPISEGERHFVLAMIACARGDADTAFVSAQKAVEAGLPPERLMAGPREALKPLYAHDGYKKWVEPKLQSLIHGPMVGKVTDSAISIWVRTDGERKVEISLNPVLPEGIKQDARRLAGSTTTSAESDYTATITVSDLAPNQQYRYSVYIDGTEVASDKQVKTYPTSGKPAKVSIAFGGGAGFTPEKERMWKTIGKHEVNALLLLGDNVYIDDPEHAVSQQYCYYRRHSQADWRTLIANTGVYTIYDDHDFGNNDCVPGPDIATPPWKRDVWNTFTYNWNNPAYGGGEKQPGCWYDFYIADVHFIMLDCRYYRDLKGGSMMGPVQKKWLLDTLAASKGTFKVIASSVPWSPGVKGGSKDTWDGFPKEREEIFAFLEEKKINGTILMAADRHRSDFRKIARPNGYALYEMMSSRLTNMHVHGLIENAKGSEFIMGYNKDCSFGLVEFDTTAEDPTLKYTIITIDDEAVDSRTLKLSELTFK